MEAWNSVKLCVKTAVAPLRVRISELVLGLVTSQFKNSSFAL